MGRMPTKIADSAITPPNVTLSAPNVTLSAPNVTLSSSKGAPPSQDPPNVTLSAPMSP